MLVASLLVPLALLVTAAPASAATPAPGGGPPSDVRELTRTDFTLDGRKVETPQRFPSKRAAPRSAAPGVTPAVGTVRQWLGLDDRLGQLYRKDYTLRGVGTDIEVWVANDIAFPAGDCRGTAATDITDAQVTSLITEFDTNIYPKESAAFSVPPDRDGTNATLAPDAQGRGGDYGGAGNKIVTLVDNVRDDNYSTFPQFPTYIAGFFSSQFTELFDRNAMTIDAFDWLHRTGAKPADEPTPDVCTSRPARPILYESVFAHEYQHLLHYYTDPAESYLLNEGLSDFAQTLTGYTDATRTVFDRGTNSHIQCFQGFGTVTTDYNTNPRDCGGPENSLNLWNEGGNPNAVLADYGQAYSFMLFLWDRYGTDFMSTLHRDGTKQDLASITADLKARNVDFYSVLHDFQTMNLVDRIIGDAKGPVVLGVPTSRVTTKSLRAEVNLDNPASYATPGAAPNGADYVQLKAGGKPLTGLDLRSATFTGAANLPSAPLAWTVRDDDPDRAGNPVLFSGNTSSLDAAAVAGVVVPTAGAELTFLAKYGAELTYDYAYVEVSTDGGATYTAIPGDKTVDGPRGPALNGTTSGFEPRRYDLSAYAGKNVLLSFRYVSDGGVDEGGFLVDDVKVGGTLVSDGASLTPFRSPAQVRPTKVANWNVKLVGIRPGSVPVVEQLESNGRNSVTLNRLQLAVLAPAQQVVAIVAQDEPTGKRTEYAPYALTVNGALQPGGGTLAAQPQGLSDRP